VGLWVNINKLTSIAFPPAVYLLNLVYTTHTCFSSVIARRHCTLSKIERAPAAAPFSRSKLNSPFAKFIYIYRWPTLRAHIQLFICVRVINVTSNFAYETLFLGTFDLCFSMEYGNLSPKWCLITMRALVDSS